MYARPIAGLRCTGRFTPPAGYRLTLFGKYLLGQFKTGYPANRYILFRFQQGVCFLVLPGRFDIIRLIRFQLLMRLDRKSVV